MHGAGEWGREGGYLGQTTPPPTFSAHLLHSMSLASRPFIHRSIRLIWIAVLFLFTSNYMLNRIRHACRRLVPQWNEEMQTHAHARTAHGPLCHIANTSHQAPVYESNEKRPHCLRWRSAVGPDSHTECQLPGSGLASQRNRGENQINLSLLTVVGFDPIWELATHSILFVFTWRMHTEGQRLSEGSGFIFYFLKRWTERKREERKRAVRSKRLSCLAPVQVGAVTQTAESVSPFHSWRSFGERCAKWCRTRWAECGTSERETDERGRRRWGRNN